MDDAAVIIQAVQERHFDGRQITMDCLPRAVYNHLFPDVDDSVWAWLTVELISSLRISTAWLASAHRGSRQPGWHRLTVVLDSMTATGIDSLQISTAWLASAHRGSRQSDWHQASFSKYCCLNCSKSSSDRLVGIWHFCTGSGTFLFVMASRVCIGML